MDLSIAAPHPFIRIASAAEPVQQVRDGCDTCAVRALCVRNNLGDDALPRVGRRRLRAGQALFRSGEPFSACWSVRSGTIKLTLEMTDGREQVTGFHFPGELIGADGLAANRYATTAVALEDCIVCALPFSVIVEQGMASRGRSPLWSAMAHEILRGRELTALLASSGADERVAAFLVDVAQRLAARGWSPHEFHLRMSRADIGSLLGMTMESVSRAFTALARQGVLEVHRKHVRIVDRARLEACAPQRPLSWLRDLPQSMAA